MNTLRQHSPREPASPAVVILATELSRDLEDLRHTLEEHELRIVEVTTYKEALSAVGTLGPTALFCDEKLPWRDLLSYLAESCDRPRIIVVAAAPSESLCAEVVNLGGFDVVAKPFCAQDVEWLLATACSIPHSVRTRPASEDSAPTALAQTA